MNGKAFPAREQPAKCSVASGILWRVADAVFRFEALVAVIRLALAREQSQNRQCHHQEKNG